jgi:hypothetical protein
MIKDLDQLTGEAEQFGLVMSTESAKAADRLGDAMELLTSVLGSVTKAIGGALAPMLTDLSIEMAGVGKRVKDFIKDHQPMIVMAFKVGAGIAAVGAAFVTAGAAISGVGAVLGGFAGVFTAISAGVALLVSPIGLITAGFVGMTTYMVKTGQASTATLGSMKDALGALLAEAKTTFGGIADALKGGDIMLAGKILWAGLKVEFYKGLNYLKGLWVDWSASVMDVFTNVKFAIAGVFANLGPNISKDFIAVTGSLHDAFVLVIGQIKVAWGAFSNYLVDIFEGNMAGIVKALITTVSEVKRQIAIFKNVSSFGVIKLQPELVRINKEEEKAKSDTDKTLAEHRTNRKRQQEATEAAPGQEILANQLERDKKLRGIESTRVGAQGVLESDKKAELEARRKAAQDMLSSGQGDLAKAQKELDELNLNARVAAAQGMKGMPLGSKAPPDLSGLGFDRGFQQLKGEVKGSFSAGALGGLGSGETVQDEQLKELKKLNESNQTIARKIDRNRMVVR